MKTIKAALTFVTGIITGAAGLYLLLNFYTVKQSADFITIKQISGEKIIHDNYDFSGRSIKFKTIADGKGEAETEIPKTLIPEADNWMNCVQSINLSFGYVFDFGSRDITPYIGLSYGYRINRVTLGGGFDISKEFIGVKAQAGLCW